MEDERKRRIYNNKYLTKEMEEEEEGGPKKGKGLLGCERSWGFPSSSEGSLLPGTLCRLILCVFHPQNKSLPHQSPTFGPTLYKFIVMGSVRKLRPYTNKLVCQTCLLRVMRVNPFMTHFLLCHFRVNPFMTQTH